MTPAEFYYELLLKLHEEFPTDKRHNITLSDDLSRLRITVWVGDRQYWGYFTFEENDTPESLCNEIVEAIANPETNWPEGPLARSGETGNNRTSRAKSP